MSTKERKQEIEKFFKEKAILKDVNVLSNTFTKHKFTIGLETSIRGVYKGYSKVVSPFTQYGGRNKVNYYEFEVNFNSGKLTIKGIQGSELSLSEYTLNRVFGWGDWETDNKALEKLKILGTMAGGWYEYESVNIGRGLKRVINDYPFLEQLLTANFIEATSVPRDLCFTIKRFYSTSSSKSLRKALMLSKKNYKFWYSMEDLGSAEDYLRISKKYQNMLSDIVKYAQEIDNERGYHDASSWSKEFTEQLIYNFSTFADTNNNFVVIMDILNNASPETNNLRYLVRYLYGSCYHQQALSIRNSLDTLKDYLCLVSHYNSFVKYPRYLKTAHDVASSNYRVISNTEYAKGVKKSYLKWFKQLEYTVGDYSFILPCLPEEIADEATQQHNCVAGYIGSVAKGNSIIMFMRHKETPKESCVTFELVPTSKGLDIIQYYCAENKSLNDFQKASLMSYANAVGVNFNYASGFKRYLKKELVAESHMKLVHSIFDEKAISKAEERFKVSLGKIIPAKLDYKVKEL